MKTYDSYKDSGVEWIGEIPTNWKRGRLKHYFNLSSGKNPVDFDKESGQFPVYGSNGVIGYTNNPDLNKETILIGRVGSSGELNLNNFPCSVSDNCLVVELKGNHDLRFVYYILIKTELKNYTTKTSQPLITGSTIKEIETILPPLSEQQQIVSFLDTKTSLIDSLIEKTQRKIELLKEKRTSIINEAVTKGLNPKSEMKDSGVEWIGEIPSHWETMKLKYQGNVIIGLSYSPDNIVEEGEESTLVMRSSNVQKGEPCFNDNVYVNAEIPAKLRTRKDDILICSRNGSRRLIGKNCLLREEHEGMTWGVFMTVYRSKAPKFFYWLLNSPVFESQSGLFLTSTINQLTVSTLENMVVPFVSDINEQTQIVEYLDEQTQKIDKTITVEERRIDLLREYRQSLISSIVTGKIKVTEDA